MLEIFKEQASISVLKQEYDRLMIEAHLLDNSMKREKTSKYLKAKRILNRIYSIKAMYN